MKEIDTIHFKILRAFVLSLFLFFLINCSSKDLEFIGPYQFATNEFEDVDVDIPEIVEEEPEVEEPEVNEIAEPTEIQDKITGLENIDSEEDIPEDLENLLLNVVDYVEEQEEEKIAAVDRISDVLDETIIDEILNEDTALEDLDQTVLDLATNAPLRDELEALFPSLDLPPLPGIGDRIILDESDEVWEALLTFRINTLVGPCADVARATFDQNLNALNASRQSQLDVIEANLQRRLGEVEDRFQSRNLSARSNFANELARVRAIMRAYLQSSRRVGLFSPRVALNIRYYAVLYMHYYRFLIERRFSHSLEVNQILRQREINQVNAIRNNSLQVLNDDYSTRLAELETRLRNALNNCHNQGLID